MVDPVSDEERADFVRRVKIAFVALVGFSGGLISLQGNVDWPVVLAAVATGLAVGVVLLWIAFPSRDDLDGGAAAQRRRRNR